MKKGFTLIELLAVIIILAVIALITIPLVINTIDEARRGSFKDSAYGIISAAEQKQAKEALNNGGIPQVQIYDLTATDLSYKGKKPKEGKAVVNGKGQVALEMNNGSLCITKGYKDKDIKVTEVTEENPCDGSGAGLTPETCFVTEDNEDGGITITDYTCDSHPISYDINYEKCMASFEETDISESDQELICKGKEDSEGISIAKELLEGAQWLIEEGIIENVAWSDSITDVVIPSKIGGKNVTSIGDFAFDSNGLTNVEIPSSVTSIGINAFASNQLTSVTIPGSVTSITMQAFIFNQLKSVTIPSSVTSLGCNLFGGNGGIVITNESSQVYKESCIKDSGSQGAGSWDKA